MASGTIPKKFSYVRQFNVVIQQNLTTTNTTYATYSGRKFTDADILIFIARDNNQNIRCTRTLPQVDWSNGISVIMDMTHGLNASEHAFITAIYNSDGSVNAYTSGSSGIKIFEIVGIKFQ